MSGIVVGVDGSPGSRAALHWAHAEARLRSTTLTAVSVWQVPMMTTMPSFGAMPPLDDLTEASEAALLAVLDEEDVHPTDEVPVESVIAEGAAAPALIEVARDAELLVVGSRGHGGFTGVLLGSVSQHCVNHATCPVVVVRADTTIA
jgi:nucleotide-binding universal stress UspA family protein